MAKKEVEKMIKNEYRITNIEQGMSKDGAPQARSFLILIHGAKRRFPSTFDISIPYYLLLTPYYLLSTTYYLLLTTYYLLPTT
jgi:hypothetical protein